MRTITIFLPDERFTRLEEAAARLGLSPEELASRGIEALLALPEPGVREAADYVLQKNAELYRRLA